MSDIDLKAYTARAVELESAIYTQKKLMEEHQKVIRKERPAAPRTPNLQHPVKPIKPNTPDTKSGGIDLIIVGCLVCVGCIGMMAAVPALGIFMIIACAIGFGSILSGRSRDSENARKANEQYERDLQEYNQKLAQYQSNYQKAYEHYSTMMEKYNVRVDEYDQKGTQITQKHYDVLASLETALQEFYDQNVIFPKYRNMVAITTINEYLMSGRCYELEGPNGAYNLYEMELRQNIIIGQLSSIISSLEQIRNNQFSLYKELVQANTTVKEILYEVHGVNENTRLTAYFAGVTALIEASPKVYIGHTF